ncbi:IS3 family transposase, partial [Ruoffia sp. FAM 26254]
MIQETYEAPENTMTIEALCQQCGVSKSGYYRWKKMTQVNIEKREREDQRDFSLVLEAFNYRQKPKGQRQILMYLAHNRTPMCRSKIRRLMKKFNLVCPIRKPRFQRQVSAEYQAEHVKPNYVKREFRAYGPRSVLLTDITYLPY